MTAPSDPMPEVPHRGDDYEGHHKWGPWSKPYDAWVNGPEGPHQKWQSRVCQCGNKDWRPAPDPNVDGWM